jgi:O-antigen ligase
MTTVTNEDHIRSYRRVYAPKKFNTNPILWTARLISVLAGVLLVLSLSPGYFGLGTYAASFWRISMILMPVAIWVANGRFSINFSILRIYGPFLAIILISVFINYSSSEIWMVLIRNIFMITVLAVCASDYVEKGSESITGIFIKTVFIGTFILSIIASIEVLKSGWSWEGARAAKGAGFDKGTLLANLSLFILSLGIVTIQFRNQWMRYLVFIPFLIVSVALATRTPALALIIATLIAFMIKPIVSSLLSNKLRIFGYLLIGFVMIAPIFILLYLIANPNPELGRMLAGRLSLWQAGYLQWTESPIFGNFTRPFQDAMIAAKPVMVFKYEWEFRTLYELNGGGGFHSTWIETFACYGLVGFIGVFLAYFGLMIKAFKSKYLGMSIVVMLLFVRSFAEISGPLGYANGAMDFICGMCLAHLFAQQNLIDLKASYKQQTAEA